MCLAMLVTLPVSKIVRVHPKIFPRFYREKYKRKIRKGFFFLWNEGLWTTLRKYRSKILENRIENEQEIIIAHIDIGSRKFAGFTRCLGESYIFNTRLIFELSNGFDIQHVKLSEVVSRFLETYLPVPSCPLPVNLPTMILEDNSFLKQTNIEYIFERFSTEKSSAKDESKLYNSIRSKTKTLRTKNRLCVYFIGFGTYVREYIMPHFTAQAAAAVDYKAALIKKHVLVKFPVFDQLDDVLEMLVSNVEPLVVISTYHSDHASVAFEVLRANPHARVFIEKPTAVELPDVKRLMQHRRDGAWIDIGYNRRYAPFIQLVREKIDNLPRPLNITILVKELKIPKTHWYFWPNQGTRITGNLCHWIDLVYYFIQLPPIELTLLNTGDNVSIAILFQDGTLASIIASDHGDDLRGVEEFIDIRGGETTITLRDFKEIIIRSGRYKKRIKRFRRDKGHTIMYHNLKRRWRQGISPLYTLEDLYWVSYITYQASNMLISDQRFHKVNPLNIYKEALLD